MNERIEEINRTILELKRKIRKCEEDIKVEQKNNSQLEEAANEMVKQKQMTETDVSNYLASVRNQTSEFASKKFASNYMSDIEKMMRNDAENGVIAMLVSQISNIKRELGKKEEYISKKKQELRNYEYQIEELKAELTTLSASIER